MKFSGPRGDDVRIEKEIVEEWLDGVEGVRAAELEEDDADALFWIVEA